MNLTTEQIEKLFDFTNKKFVRWYDLQVELVDHLANKIEALMIENPSLSFERALGDVYQSFGLFGFAHIVQQKENEMCKQNNKLWWSEFMAQFSWPNILRTVAVIGICIVLGKQVLNAEWLLIILSILNITLFVTTFRLVMPKRKTKIATATPKPLLMLQFTPINNFFSLFYTQLLLQFGSKILFNQNSTELQQLFLFIFSALVGIALFAGLRVVKNLHNKARQQYPKAFA